MILEFCAENVTKIPDAIAKGATRIELCDNLAEGGTTPSYGVIQAAVHYANQHQATIAVMIRPRGGDFVYSDAEFEIMKQDLEVAKKLGAHGVVFGCLDETKRVERLQMKELLKQSGEMETVFHMAFDEIPREVALEELNWLIQQGVTRILTHGGREGTVLDHVDWLKELIKFADDRIEILIGGGVTYENVPIISEKLPVDQFHGTKIVDFGK